MINTQLKIQNVQKNPKNGYVKFDLVFPDRQVVQVLADQDGRVQQMEPNQFRMFDVWWVFQMNQCKVRSMVNLLELPHTALQYDHLDLPAVMQVNDYMNMSQDIKRFTVLFNEVLQAVQNQEVSGYKLGTSEYSLLMGLNLGRKSAANLQGELISKNNIQLCSDMRDFYRVRLNADRMRLEIPFFGQMLAFQNLQSNRPPHLNEIGVTVQDLLYSRMEMNENIANACQFAKHYGMHLVVWSERHHLVSGYCRMAIQHSTKKPDDAALFVVMDEHIKGNQWRQLVEEQALPYINQTSDSMLHLKQGMVVKQDVRTKYALDLMNKELSDMKIQMQEDLADDPNILVPMGVGLVLDGNQLVLKLQVKYLDSQMQREQMGDLEQEQWKDLARPLLNGIPMEWEDLIQLFNLGNRDRLILKK